MQFRDAVDDLIKYGLSRYSDTYSDTDEDNLVLYQKYSRRGVCRILNWEKFSGSATETFGTREENMDYLI